MTTPRSLSKLLVVAVLLVVVPAAISFSLSGCTDSEQQAQLDHQKRVEEQEAKDAAEKAKSLALDPVPGVTETAPAAPEPEQTPEAPPEPEKVYSYNFSGTACECQERSQCGMSFWRCSNGKTYDCQTNTSYVATTVLKKDSYEECKYDTQN